MLDKEIMCSYFPDVCRRFVKNMLTVFKVFIIVFVFAFLMAEGHWGYEKKQMQKFLGEQ